MRKKESEQPTYEELEKTCKRLQKQVSHSINLQQQLVNAKNNLDDELRRFQLIQQYGQEALRASSQEKFGIITTEAFIETFNEARAVFFSFNLSLERLETIGSFGLEDIKIPTHIPFNSFFLKNQSKKCSLLEKNRLLSKKFTILHLDTAYVCPFFNKKGNFAGLIIVGHSKEEGKFYPPLASNNFPSFTTMTQTAGMLWKNQQFNERLKQEIEERIVMQIALIDSQDDLEEAKRDLERKVETRTQDLKRSNERLQQEILERKQIEKKLIDQTSELKRSNEDLEQFAYVASHDLKTPLRNIASFSQLFYRKYRNQIDDTGKEYLDFIMNGVKRFNSIIDDLLHFSRVSKSHDEVEPVDFNRVIRRVIRSLYQPISKTETIINAEQLPTLSANGFQIEQLFQNLIENAIKFRGEGTPIITISAEKKGIYYEFSVRDNGIGIDEQYKHKIFTLFQRLHTELKYQGTGIGLSICKKVIDRHHGEIWFKSKLNHGTTFYFTIPSNLRKIG